MNDTTGDRPLTEDDIRTILSRLMPSSAEARRRAFSAALGSLAADDGGASR
jgi:hypothetical protein